MPAYQFLFSQKADLKSLPKRIAVQSRLGVPYPAMDKHEIEQHARDQALEIAKNLVSAGAYLKDREDLTGDLLVRELAESKVVALIAYVQKIGVYELREDLPPPNPLSPDNHRRRSKKDGELPLGQIK